MSSAPSRRRFVRDAAALSLTALLPDAVFSQSQATKSAVVRVDSEIGVVRPELHSHFAEHLGSCVYGGLWVGKQSRIPNVDGYRKASIDYLRELGIPVLRWPGGCYADNYHWRDGIGPVNKRPKRVNANWADAMEDGSFGLHEFIGLCRLIGAEPYLSVNVGSGSPQEALDWLEPEQHRAASSSDPGRRLGGAPGSAGAIGGDGDDSGVKRCGVGVS
ncbi:MAG: hypothetical protein ABSC23_10285 [Bryobacteraceae bacterium]